MSSVTAGAARRKKPLYKDLFFQVIIAIIAGIALGHVAPAWAIAMKPLGDGFIQLIKMLIAPIIFCTMVGGIAGMGSMKQVGRVGAKAILWFEIITTLALVIGLVLMDVLKPGAGLHIDVSNIDIGNVREKMAQGHMASATDFFLHMIPSTLVGAFANGEILQVLLVAILFAAALSALGSKGREALSIIEAFSHVLFKMVDIITLAAPIGAFGAMAYSIGKFGVASLKDLGELIIIFYATGALFIVLVLAPVMRFYCRLSTWQFIRYIGEELMIAMGTSSSETVLPRLMEKLVAMGCAKPVVGLVIPAGYSFNLVGSSIYFTMAALFICYATHTPLGLWQELTLLGVLLVTSKGAAGVTGSAFLVLAATLSSMDLVPPQNLEVGLALIFAIDRFMSTGRAIVNLVGNG
ncbi:MAG: C4-dicarboxylate transporter DctA, partial [Pseudomonadota bacterium]|nr:C4-dicarboxylate transporter DctA [Pseudomonadota bacterium]